MEAPFKTFCPKKLEDSASGHALLALPLKVRDLEPGTPQVIAEMLFEKFNQTAFLIGAAFKTQRAQRTVKRDGTR